MTASHRGVGEAESLGGLPAFLALLTNHPGADEVLTALLAGPLAPFGPVGAHLSRYDGAGLVRVGRTGWPEEEMDGFLRSSLDDDLPSTRAFIDLVPIIGDGGIVDEFDDLRPHRDPLSMMSSRGHLGSVAAFPLIASGTSVGVVGFTCREPHSWSSLEISLLVALGAAMGVWLSAQSTGPAHQPVDTVQLTPRQRRILTCVLRGRTNAAIASSLGYSNSTVKQDISRAMRHLGASTRYEAATRAADLGLLDGAP